MIGALVPYTTPDFFVIWQDRAGWLECKMKERLLEEYVQKDVKIAQLEAELTRYHGYLEHLRISIQPQEHGN